MAKILIIDDNAINRKLLAALLSSDGHWTLEASDGLDGLQAARAERPQLVISDVVMPSMDGYGFVRALRADPDLSSIPVIFYTAHYHERGARKLAKDLNVARVLVKPCSHAELSKAVEQAIAGVFETHSFSMPSEFDREHLMLVTNKLSERIDALAAANARLAALTEFNVELASERQANVLLERVCSGARSLLGARYAFLSMTNDRGAGCSFFSVSGIAIIGKSLPAPVVESGPLRDVVAERRAVRKMEDAAGVANISGLPKGYPAVRAFLAAPLCTDLRAYGWLCLADKLGTPNFDADDERLLVSLGALATRIYENSLLQVELVQRVAEQRRDT